jgi:hypothetical protein
MSNIVVKSEKVIARPIREVQSQFIDFAHHERAGIHKGFQVSNVRPLATGCQYTGRRRVFGALQEDEYEVRVNPDGSSSMRSISGTNVGTTIKQTFESRGPNSTLVRLEVDMPLKGFFRLLAPLMRVGIQQDLKSALEEDRIDLEERGYTKS